MQTLMSHPALQVIVAVVVFGLFLMAIYNWDMRRTEYRSVIRSRDTMEITLVEFTLSLLDVAVQTHTDPETGRINWTGVHSYLDAHVRHITKGLSKMEQDYECRVLINHFTHDGNITFTVEGYFTTHERSRTLVLQPNQKVA